MKIDVEKYKGEKFSELLKCRPSRCELTLDWKNSFKNGPGIYVVKIKDEIVYAGETSNLRKRMNDMRNTMHHTLRRNIGNEKFIDENGFQVATSRKRYIDSIETKLENFMRNNLLVYTLSLDLGRKELEEYIIEINGKPKYNLKGNDRLNSRNK
jgi:hypothetical protein